MRYRPCFAMLSVGGNNQLKPRVKEEGVIRELYCNKDRRRVVNIIQNINSIKELRTAQVFAKISHRGIFMAACLSKYKLGGKEIYPGWSSIFSIT